MASRRTRPGRARSQGPDRGDDVRQADGNSQGMAVVRGSPTATNRPKAAPERPLGPELGSRLRAPKKGQRAPLPSPLSAKGRLFSYQIELQLSGPVPVFAGYASIDCKFRHSHHSAIELRPGASRQLNVGFRVYDPTSETLLFEDRMQPATNFVEPGRWIGGRINIPRDAIPLSGLAALAVDMVKEDEFWFAGTPEEAHRFSVAFFDVAGNAIKPSDASGAANGGYAATDLLFELPSAMSAPALSEYPAEPAAVAIDSNIRYHLVFDVSDLVQYFHEARLPAGIQRVQMQIITALTFNLPDEFTLTIACFRKNFDSWTELPPLFFQRICNLALVSGERDALDWRRAVAELETRTERGPPLAFPHGAFLINLGTSWWLRNYFLNVRLAKARFGIRYVPYVHDCIPIITPEHCVSNLTRDFISWAIGAFQHADHVIANSHATAVDVGRVARYLGHAIPEPAIVRLDASYGHATTSKLPLRTNSAFVSDDLRPGEYVLFVSTIESRKNHLLAFSAWLTLIKRFGISRVPKLVCVGNRGWLNDAIYAKLAASDSLQQQVVMLSGISDADLERLYRNCLFTLFPSSYEGWGLPVTESLCCGKVPLVSNCSSLPEAGGEFAEYFDVGSEPELVDRLERLIFDAEYRKAREDKIVSEFRPRSWAEIGINVLDLVREWAANEFAVKRTSAAWPDNELWPFEARPGRYYGLTEIAETRIWPGMVSGEMFRQGSGWWWPEPWGTWTKPPAARLAFLVPFAEGTSAMLFVGVRGVQSTHSTATVRVSGIGAQRVSLSPGQNHWLAFHAPAERVSKLRVQQQQALFEILFSADQVADFRDSTDGVDQRTASLGVRGFMVCAEDDVRSRLRFIEGVSLGTLASLEERPMEADGLLG
jgi:glycosyltransferase involved in cell wall biosynthesis